MKILIKNAKIVNENIISEGDVYIEDQIIKEISSSISLKSSSVHVIDAEGKYLLPGLIDDQVHFREPGLTHKENIKTGFCNSGVTNFVCWSSSCSVDINELNPIDTNNLNWKIDV